MQIRTFGNVSFSGDVEFALSFYNKPRSEFTIPWPEENLIQEESKTEESENAKKSQVLIEEDHDDGK